MRFNQANKKILELYNKIGNNQNELTQRENSKSVLSFFNHYNKTAKTIYDTGWTAITPDSNALSTIHKNDLLPESISISEDLDIDIPEIFLPYVEPVVFTKLPPDSQMVSYYEYTTENWYGDYIHVEGDGGLIYKGVYPEPDDIYTQSYVDNGQILEANTKKVYQSTIYYTDGDGNNWKVTGEVIQIIARDDFETCDQGGTPVDIYDTFECSTFVPTEPPYHKITDLDGSGFTGVGDFEDKTFTSPTPTCSIGTVQTTEVTKTYTFGSLYSYYIVISGSRVNVDTGAGSSGNFGIESDEITSKSFVFSGYRLYYSNLTQNTFEAVSGSGIELSNLPDTGDGDTLPYTTLTLDRNPVGFPTATVEATDLFTISMIGNFVMGNQIKKDLSYFLIDGSSELKKYRVKLDLGVAFITPASIESPNPTIQTQVDAYTVSGTTYTRSTNTTGLKTNGTYVTPKQDVQYRVMLVIKNPTLYKETRKYDTSQ